MRTPEWYRTKAGSYERGWKTRFGVEPSAANTALGLSVAVHESWAGDSSVATHNWGSTQRRLPNAVEKVVLKDIAPKVANVAAGRAALAAAGIVPDRAELYVDSNPGAGYYWVLFWAFPTDDEGASFFIKVLATDRPSCRNVLEGDANPLALAAAMYRSTYFTGFFKKTSHYERQPTGKWIEIPSETTTSWTGAELNIDRYAGALLKLLPEIKLALSGKPAVRTLRRGDRGEDVKAVQRIVGVPVEGIFGPRTESAVMGYQLGNHLTADGIVGPLTRAAMESP
jgi:peptidoglycan hydrolase-like protein with peptidoglycan-binding domain